MGSSGAEGGWVSRETAHLGLAGGRSSTQPLPGLLHRRGTPAGGFPQTSANHKQDQSPSWLPGLLLLGPSSLQACCPRLQLLAETCRLDNRRTLLALKGHQPSSRLQRILQTRGSPAGLGLTFDPSALSRSSRLGWHHCSGLLQHGHHLVLGGRLRDRTQLSAARPTASTLLLPHPPSSPSPLPLTLSLPVALFILS